LQQWKDGELHSAGKYMVDGDSSDGVLLSEKPLSSSGYQCMVNTS
jgi:hypothetical protein